MTCMGADSGSGSHIGIRFKYMIYQDSRCRTRLFFCCPFSGRITLRHRVAKLEVKNLKGKGVIVLGRRAVSQELLLLGERIRDQRIKLCLSQEALAEKAGISTNTVSRIEGGQMSMTIGIFIKLVQALETDADKLLGIMPEPGGRQYQHLFRRISHLRAGEKEIVLRTVETLVEEMRRNR